MWRELNLVNILHLGSKIVCTVHAIAAVVQRVFLLILLPRWYNTCSI